MRQCYRGLQLALLNLREAPDFRRAAAAAQRANLVPVAFRQHQFRRFRPLLVAYLTSKLQRGGSAGQATAGLRELIAALGMPNFEADYILTEARGRTTVGPPPTFADQARQWQCEHQERLQAIRALPDLDPDVREQLTELEQERFRDQLMRSGGSDTSSDHRSSLRG
ncbi:MAG: hypothetical protein ACKVP0_14490 [Pirellulaceae bacterium]